MEKFAIRSTHRPNESTEFFADSHKHKLSLEVAREYLKENKIPHRQSGGFGYIRIEFENRTDMLLFVLMHQDSWEVINFNA